MLSFTQHVFITKALRSLWAQHVLGLHPLIELLRCEVAELHGRGLQGRPLFVRGLGDLRGLVVAWRKKGKAAEEWVVKAGSLEEKVVIVHLVVRLLSSVAIFFHLKNTEQWWSYCHF